jgi:hypothetical protein
MAAHTGAVTANFPFPVPMTVGTITMDPTFTTILSPPKATVSMVASTSSLGGGIHHPQHWRQGLHGSDAADDAAEANIAEGNHLHKAQGPKYSTYYNVDKALHIQLIKGVPDIFLSALLDPVIDFGNTTSLELIVHLRATYGIITENELKENTLWIQHQWNPQKEIEVMYLQIEEGVPFAAAGLDPPTKHTVLQWAYNVVDKCGHFNLACHEWRQMPVKDNTWVLFKNHFNAAYNDLPRGYTTTTAGFHGAAN